MITCSSYRGQSYNPISQFDCLADDIPYLPKNKEGIIIEDINFDYTDESALAQISVRQNTFLHKIKLDKVPDNTNYIQIKSLFIVGVDESGTRKISISPSIETAPEGVRFEHYGGLDPTLGKIQLNGKKFFFADMNVEKMTEIDVKDMQKYDSSVVKVSKIILDLYFYNDDTELGKKQIPLIVTDKKTIEQTKKKSKKNMNITTKGYSGLSITNGSVAFCMDTSEVYKFDEEYDRWLKI